MTWRQIIVLPSQHTSFPRRERRNRQGDTDGRRPVRKRRLKGRAPSFSRCGRHPRHGASGTKRLLSERSWSEAGGGVRPFIPIQARKAKEETRKKQERKKKEGRRNADRRVVHDPRFGAARADRSALACRRSTTALAAANERHWPAPGSADTELGVLMEPEVCHGETEVYTGVQA